MKILGFACKRCLWRLRWASVVAVVLSFGVLLESPGPAGMGIEAERAAALWLHAPAFLLTAALLATAVEVWPLFARRRPGADVLERIQPGILDGCGAASAGALAALALALTLVAAVFAGALTAFVSPPDLRTHYRLAPDREFLDAQTPELTCLCPSGVVLEAILLRPRSILPSPDAFRPTGVEVFGDGEMLHRGMVELGGQLEDHRLDFPPRAIDRLQIRLTEQAGPPLLFGLDGIRAVGATPHSWVLGCITAALAYLLPAFLALACACLLGRHVGTPVVVVGMLAVLVVATVSDFSPNSEAITALARERWLLDEDPVRRIAPSLSAAGLVIMLAMATRREGYR